MRGAVVWVVVLGAALGLAAPAGAQSPSYGGGLLPTAASARGYEPTLGIVLQPRGNTIAFRFDSSIFCGGTVYDTVGRGTVPFDGRSFSARAARQYPIGRRRGNRIVFSWRLRGELDGTIASGRLHITGARYVQGRRTRCRRKPDRSFLARVEGAAATGSPAPPGLAAFGGLSAIRIAQGLRAPVVLRVERNAKKIGARWTVLSGCGKGPRNDFVNYSPPMRIRPDGSFSRSERFSVSYADALIRYRVRFAGRISGEAANGVLRLRARVFSADGKRLRTRCDSGTRGWSAALLRAIAPAPAGTPAPATGTPEPTSGPSGEPQPGTAGAWSLTRTSDENDWVGAGRDWSYRSPENTIAVRAYRYGITFHISAPDTSWSGTFTARSYQEPLVPGTYVAQSPSSTSGGTAGMSVSGDGRACKSQGTFTIHEIVFDGADRLRRVRLDFEQHCEGNPPALRGTWDFTAA